MRRYSSFLLLFLSTRKSSFLRSRVGNARQRVLLADCFPIACITIVQDSPPRFFSSSLSVSVYGFFFYDFGNDGAAVSSPGVDANYGESGESSQNCDGNFIFRLRRSFEPFQFLEVSIVNALHMQGHYLAGYTVYSRALRYIGDIFSSE